MLVVKVLRVLTVGFSSLLWIGSTAEVFTEMRLGTRSRCSVAKWSVSEGDGMACLLQWCTMV